MKREFTANDHFQEKMNALQDRFERGQDVSVVARSYLQRLREGDWEGMTDEFRAAHIELLSKVYLPKRRISSPAKRVSLSSVISVPLDTPYKKEEGKNVTHVLFALDTKGRLWEANFNGYHAFDWHPSNIPLEDDWFSSKEVVEVDGGYELKEGETWVETPPCQSPLTP